MTTYFVNSGNVALNPVYASAYVFNFNGCETIEEAKEVARDYLVRAEMLPEDSLLPEEAWQECLPVWRDPMSSAEE